AMLALLVFSAALLLLDLLTGAGFLRLGRRLETRLRMTLLEKLPRLGDRYFQSRLVSDMAQRAHNLPLLRGLPALATGVVRSSVQLGLTAVGLSWLDPGSAPAAAVFAALAFAIPFLTRGTLTERELRKRSHSAAMSRFYLDSLLGLLAARTHGAERALRRGHENMLVVWANAALDLLRAGVVIEGVQALVGFCGSAWLVLGYVERDGNPGGMLLFMYWALSMPSLGRQLALALQQYPAQRNVLLRLLEPLGAPNETDAAQSIDPATRLSEEP